MTSTTLPSTGAVTGLKETLDFFRDPSFTQQRFEQYGDVFIRSIEKEISKHN